MFSSATFIMSIESTGWSISVITATKSNLINFLMKRKTTEPSRNKSKCRMVDGTAKIAVDFDIMHLCDLTRQLDNVKNSRYNFTRVIISCYDSNSSI